MALHTGGPMTLTAERDGRRFDVTLVPTESMIDTASGPVRVFRLGIIAPDEFEVVSYGPIEAAGNALRTQVEITGMVFSGLGQVITGRRPVSELEGPSASPSTSPKPRSGLCKSCS